MSKISRMLLDTCKYLLVIALVFLQTPSRVYSGGEFIPAYQEGEPEGQTWLEEKPVWQTYSDPQWNISFDYLSNWVLSETILEEENLRELELFHPQEGRIFITRMENPEKLSPSEWFESSRTSYNDLIQEIATIEIQGVPAVFIGLPKTCKSAPLLEVLLGRGDKLFKVSFFGTGLPSASSELKRLLESLSFNGQHPTTSIPNSYVQVPDAPEELDCEIANTVSSDLQVAALNAQICSGADFYIPAQGTLFSPYKCFNSSYCSLYKTGAGNEFGYPHSGLDIMGNQAPGVIPIYATGSGTAYVSGNSAIRILFTNPTWSSYSAYNAHMATGVFGQSSYQDFRKAKTGDTVIGGKTIIGYMGNFDNANVGTSNVHLHISYNDAETDYMAVDETEDPTIFLKAKYLKYAVGWNNRGPFSCVDSAGSGGVDVYFLVDLTGSFEDDLVNFKSQAPGIIASLKAKNANTRFGLGKFEDYPIYPFGEASYGDQAYQRLVDLTTDTTLILNAINGLYTRNGYDIPESQLTALFQAATGAGQDLSGLGYSNASISAGQQASFRKDANKLILLWTDAPFHNPGDSGNIAYPGPSKAQVASAILSAGINNCDRLPCSPGFSSTDHTEAAAVEGLDESGLRAMVVGISSGSDGLSDLQDIARLTGARAPENGVDCDSDGTLDISPGGPLVCGISTTGDGIGAAIESLVEAALIIKYTSFLPVIHD